MKLRIFTIIALIAIQFFTPVYAQQLPAGTNLATINVEELSDAQVKAYWKQAKEQGYTMAQLETLAMAKGMSSLQVAKLKQRILSISDVAETETVPRTSDLQLTNDTDPFGVLSRAANEPQKRNLLFGYDFFNNEKISFEPNMNIATPETYKLGPGDELLIDVWGAAEKSYSLQVDRRGAVVIQDIGPVYVNGLEIAKAKAKIIAHLKKIYSGISEQSDSYSKVYAEVSLVGIRTVQVNIIGEVKVPGTYSLSALSSVLNGLYAAGGPTENGSFRTVKLIRNGKQKSLFDVYKYLTEGSQQGNEFLQDKDVIIVPPYTSKISVTGNVKRPGIFELKKDETMADLIQYFSGFTAAAYTDMLLVERMNGSQKEMLEVGKSQQVNFTMQDGDSIAVQSIIDRYQNRVSINGAVYRPGNYQFSKTLSLQTLIAKAEGLKNDAYLERGVVYREIDDVDEEVIPFSVDAIVNGTQQLLLQAEDSVYVFNKSALKEAYVVSINGAVNEPVETDFREHMRVEDLILMAGGYKEGADPAVIDIARRVVDTSFHTMSKNIKRSSTITLKLDTVSDFYLEPFDVVSVRYLKGYSNKINTSVQGEVVYPGNYVIEHKDERISDLIEKSGGFTPFAYVKGATLIRRTTNATDKEQLELLQGLIVNDSMDIDVTSKNEYMIGIDLERIMDGGHKSKYDLILEEGDVLVIPSEKQTVAVQGEVLVPSLIRFEKGKSLRDYVNGSGGFSEEAKKSKTYVVYANGDVKSTKRFLWIKTYPKVEPGAIVLVPKKEPKRKMTVSEIVGLSSALLSLALLVQNLTK